MGSQNLPILIAARKLGIPSLKDYEFVLHTPIKILNAKLQFTQPVNNCTSYTKQIS